MEEKSCELSLPTSRINSPWIIHRPWFSRHKHLYLFPILNAHKTLFFSLLYTLLPSLSSWCWLENPSLCQHEKMNSLVPPNSLCKIHTGKYLWHPLVKPLAADQWDTTSFILNTYLPKGASDSVMSLRGQHILQAAKCWASKPLDLVWTELECLSIVRPSTFWTQLGSNA